MRYAIPLAAGKLALHFGHCQEFAFVDTNEDGEITGSSRAVPPPHEPGVLPRWLAENNADVIIAGGMGGRAQNLFEQNGIHVVIGAPVDDPDALVRSYVDGTLETGANICSE